MTDPVATHPGPPLPRSRGRIGQWSDRVKALALLVMLAMAGALAGVGGAGGEGDRVRDGLSAGASGIRAALAEAPVPLLSGGDETRRPDAAGGGDGPAPKALAAVPPWGPVAVAADVPAFPPHPPGLASARAGHAARMPTGPPAGLSA